MLSKNKGLYHQLFSVLKNNCSKENSELLDKFPASVKDITLPLRDHNDSLCNANSVAIKKLQERIDSLEELAEQLYFFIGFYIENLPDIIKQNFEAGQEKINKQPGFGGHQNSTGYGNNEQDYCPENPAPTRREKDILNLLEKGFCAKEIASRLFISETTVITHKKNLKKKYGVKNSVELISKIRNPF